MSEPGTIAYVALILWIPVSFVAFMIMRPQRATVFVLLGALLFLPEQVKLKFPYLPPLTKQNIPYLCVLLGAIARAPRRMLSLPKDRWWIWLALSLLGGAVGTALTNGDALSYGTLQRTAIHGLTMKDGLYTGIDQTLHAALPLFLGLSLFRTPDDLRRLLGAFAIAALLYVPFTLVEMRMSPQFHYWIYGYHQHSFLQTMRWGGYRPMVFMSHGLALARFFVVAILGAAIVAKKQRTLLGVPTYAVVAILFVTLVLCKSTAAVAYGVAGLAVMALARARLRQLAAVVLAGTVVLYPVLRAADAFPVGRILTAASLVDPARQQSLLFRFENEDALLAKARERITFGWGEFNRAAIFDDLGRPFSVTDGHWIVLLGVMGAVGFASAFGMLLIPLFVAWRRLRAIRDPLDRQLVSGTSLIIGIVALDLIPNGLWADYPYLMAGALLGVTRTAMAASRDRPRAPRETLPVKHEHERAPAAAVV